MKNGLPYWATDMLEISFNQGNLAKLLKYIYPLGGVRVGRGICFGLNSIIMEKHSSQHSKMGTAPVEILKNYLHNLTKQKPTAQEQIKLRKAALRAYVNQNYFQKFITDKDYVQYQEANIQNIKKSFADKDIILISMTNEEGIGHALLLIKDADQFRLFDPNFGLSKLMTLEQAYNQLERIKLFYGHTKISINEINNRFLPKGMKQKVKPYHVVQILLGEVTRADQKINAENIIKDLGEDFVDYIIGEFLKDKNFQNMSSPINIDIAKRRVEKFIQTEKPDNNRTVMVTEKITELNNAIRSKNLEEVTKLLNILNTIPNNLSEHPIHIAARVGEIEIFKLVLEKSNIDEATVSKKTPLIISLMFQHSNIAELLIEAGANVNTQDSDGKTPLIIATHHAQESTIELLLSKGANVNTQDDYGKSAFHYALDGEQSISIIEKMIESGAIIDDKAFESAKNTIHENYIKQILDAQKADINISPQVLKEMGNTLTYKGQEGSSKTK